jgi:hypothetical protein
VSDGSRYGEKKVVVRDERYSTGIFGGSEMGRKGMDG